MSWTRMMIGGHSDQIPFMLFPLVWLAAVSVLGLISAVHHRKARLMPLASVAVLYVLFAYAVWLVHGLKALLTGKELGRDKPTRYARVVA